jgi:hypothetical protein
MSVVGGARTRSVVDREAAERRGDSEGAESAAGCIGRLRRRGYDLRRFLDGRSLSVELAYASGPVVRVMMTPEGRVLPATGEHFDPHVIVKGADERVASFLLGEIRLLDALTDRLVAFGARRVTDDDIPSYRAVWGLVTEELRADNG